MGFSTCSNESHEADMSIVFFLAVLTTPSKNQHLQQRLSQKMQHCAGAFCCSTSACGRSQACCWDLGFLQLFTEQHHSRGLSSRKAQQHYESASSLTILRANWLPGLAGAAPSGQTRQ